MVLSSASKPWIAGFSFSHNGAVCLLHGEEIVVAIQEERLNRRKRSTLPYGILNSHAFHYCLNRAGIDIHDIQLFVVAHNGKYLSAVQKERMVGLPPDLRERTLFMPHYLAHAHAVYAKSGFNESTILVIDGLGESLAALEDFYPQELVQRRHAVVPIPQGENVDPNEVGEIVGIYRAEGTSITLMEKHIGSWLLGSAPLQVFGSFGSMFSSVAKLIFGDELEAGKVMGLAPYGHAKFSPTDFVEVNINGEIVFRDTVTKHFHDYWEGWPANRIAFENLAYGVQAALESALSYLFKRCCLMGATKDLCYSGGVALNSVANEKAISQRYFKRHFIFPASEDSGLAVGAAYHGLWIIAPNLRGSRMKSDAMGHSYNTPEILQAVDNIPYVQVVKCKDPVYTAVEALINQKVLGWFQGRSELGPRSLGQRSILADPRNIEMKTHINSCIKYREEFRPFAPVILREELSEWFCIDEAEPDSPFMLRVMEFRESVRKLVPAVVHIDGTGRVQSLDKSTNPPLRKLLKLFFARTGVPMLLNTSFNMAGEPIVETPTDALWCMLFTGIDLLLLEDVLVRKAPDFQNILDLVPVFRTNDHLDLRQSSGGLTTLREYVEVNSGNQTIELTGDPVEVVDLCDKGKSGWSILNHLGKEWDEPRILLALAKLRQAGVINLIS